MTAELRELAPPWFHCFVGSPSDLTNFTWSLAGSGPSELVVRTVRGTKMQTVDRLFDEFAAVFQFPDYFGENWDALSECLVDLSWMPAGGYVVAIRDSAVMLSRDDVKKFHTLVNILGNVAQEWSAAVAQGEAWDRPAKPFHVVVQTLPDDTTKLSKMIADVGMAVSEISRC